jgi:hypothetical protein
LSGFAKDLRDPIYLGEWIIRTAEQLKCNFSAAYDYGVATNMLKYHGTKDYSGEMMGYYTTKAYLDELSNRTDRYAQSTLEAIKLGAKPNPIDAEIV